MQTVILTIQADELSQEQYDLLKQAVDNIAISIIDPEVNLIWYQADTDSDDDAPKPMAEVAEDLDEDALVDAAIAEDETSRTAI